MISYSTRSEQNKWKNDIATYQRMQEWIQSEEYEKHEDIQAEINELQEKYD